MMPAAAVQPIGNGHVPTSREMLAVLTWNEIKKLGVPVTTAAKRAKIDQGSVYSLLAMNTAFGTDRFQALTRVLPGLRGLAKKQEGAKKDAGVVVNDAGTMAYNQLVREGKATLFKDDPEYKSKVGKTRKRHIEPRTEPTPPVQSKAKVVVIDRRMPLEVLGDLFILLSDTGLRPRLERIALWLKGQNLHMEDVLIEVGKKR